MVFNRDNRSGGRREFGRRSFNDDRAGDRQMFKTICSNCGKDCEVPFKPSGSKPVYCRDCFRTMGGSDSRRTDDKGLRKPNFDNGGRGSNQPQYREQFETLNTKLDTILKLLNPSKPIEIPKVIVGSQVEKAVNNVGDVEPIKKKTRAKKLVLTEKTVKTPAVIEVTTESDISTKAPTQ